MATTETAAQIVTRFCDTWERRDIDELLAFFADDAVYHNVPLDPAVGLEAIRATIELFIGMAPEIRFEIVRQLTDGDVVMNERVDYLTVGDKTVALPVAGVFEIRDGKISLWRDYFDMATFMGT